MDFTGSTLPTVREAVIIIFKLKQKERDKKSDYLPLEPA